MMTIRAFVVAAASLSIVMGCGGGGDERRCSTSVGPGTCLCSDTMEPNPANEVATCDRESVLVNATTSRCCEIESTNNVCHCEAFGCYETDSGGCICGPADANEGNVPMLTCSPAVGQHCCLLVGSDVCHCSVLECDGGDIEVASCSAADSTTCRLASETNVDACL